MTNIRQTVDSIEISLHKNSEDKRFLKNGGDGEVFSY